MHNRFDQFIKSRWGPGIYDGLALPIVVRLRLEIPADPAKQTKSDREFLMNTQDVDKYLQQLHNEGLEKGLKRGLKKGRDEGRKEGRDEGFAQAVLIAYRARFGAPPEDLVTAVQQARDHAELERWLEIVTTRSVDEVNAALPRMRAVQPARRTRSRQSAAPQRTSASR